MWQEVDRPWEWLEVSLSFPAFRSAAVSCSKY